MTSVVTAVRRRVDPAPFTALVAVGDLICIAIFVFGGAAAGHNETPTTYPVRLAATYLTFVVGWATASVLGGLYTTDAWRTATRAVAWTVPAWVVAAVIAQLLRWTAVFPGDAAVTLFLVSVGVGSALLVTWRFAVVRLDAGQ